jgi:hypothetical protein
VDREDGQGTESLEETRVTSGSYTEVVSLAASVEDV